MGTEKRKVKEGEKDRTLGYTTISGVKKQESQAMKEEGRQVRKLSEVPGQASTPSSRREEEQLRKGGHGSAGVGSLQRYIKIKGGCQY